MKNKFLYVIILLTFSALLLAACGGAESNDSSNEFTISTANEFNFNPNVITVNAGKTVTITFNNTGTVNHTLNFLKPDAELDHLLEEIEEGAGEHIDEELLTDMHAIEPGHSETVLFTAPSEPGEYSFICTIPGHAEAGMIGTIKVVQ